MNILIADDDPVSRQAAPELPPEVGLRGDHGRGRRRGLAPLRRRLVPHGHHRLDDARAGRIGPAPPDPLLPASGLRLRHPPDREVPEGRPGRGDGGRCRRFPHQAVRPRRAAGPTRAGERIIRLEHHLRETQAALVQKEQLASLGRLAAGVAHEINNPIAYVINNIAVLRRDVQAALAVLDTYRQGRDALSLAEPGLAAACGAAGRRDGPGLLPGASSAGCSMERPGACSGSARSCRTSATSPGSTRRSTRRWTSTPPSARRSRPSATS